MVIYLKANFNLKRVKFNSETKKEGFKLTVIKAIRSNVARINIFYQTRSLCL